MQVALVTHSTPTLARRFSSALLPHCNPLSTSFTCIGNTCLRSACRSSRLQRLVPEVPPTEDTEEVIASIFIHDPHDLTIAEFQGRGKDLITAQQAADDAGCTPSTPHQQQLPTNTEFSEQSSQQPQLQRYNPLADDWTSSPDDEILSAAANLPAESTLGSHGFIGGRFTFGRTSALQQIPSAAQQLTQRQQIEPQDSILVQQMRDVETELHQTLTFSPLDSNSSSSSGGSYIDADSWTALATGGPNPADTAAAAAAAAAADNVKTENPDAAIAGSYFSSRSNMLQQLHLQQLQLQRQHLLNKQRKNLYNYSLSDSGSIVKKSKPGPKHPLDQISFALAKKQPMDTNPAIADSSAAQLPAANSISNNRSAPVTQQQQQGVPSLQQKQHDMQQLLPLQEAQLSGLISSAATSSTHSNSSSGSSTQWGIDRTSISSSSTPAAAAAAAAAAAGDDSDPSRGLCLSVFLYCCSQSKLLTLVWQLGLPPNALRFVSRVADADVVLHVKPRPGEKHFHYDEYRDQAAKKGIPMIDLKSLSPLELQLYLLPVYKLYAGEITPKDLLKRRKPRGWKKRYTNIKLPRA